MFRISENAFTPSWLTKRPYEKLDTDLEYEVSPMNKNELEELLHKYKSFIKEKGLGIKTGMVHNRDIK